MSTLQISGIEVTQGIQTFGNVPYRGQNAGAADNSVPLVAERRTVLRVWATGARPGTQLTATTELPTSIPGLTVLEFSNTIGVPPPTPVRARTDQSMQLELGLPEAGQHTYVVRVSEFDPATQQRRQAAAVNLPLDFVGKAGIRLRLVRIRYRGRGMNVAPIPTSDILKALEFTQRVLPLPTPAFRVVNDSVEDYDGDFTRIDPSAHDPNWAGYAANRGTTGNLLEIMDRLRSTEGQPADVAYVGVYPNGASQAVFAGWAVSGWILTSLNPIVIAHELTHRFCVPMHAPCGGPAYVDPAFPLYQGLPDASIGDVGLNTVDLSTRDPATHRDLMSYCGPMWISAYNYRKVFDCLGPPWPPLPSPQPLPPSDGPPLRLVRWPPDRWTKVDLPPLPQPPWPWPRPWPGAPRGEAGEPVVELLDEAGGSLGRAAGRYSASGSEIEPDDGVLDFVLPPGEAPAGLRVMQKGEVVWTWSDKRFGEPLGLEVRWPSEAELAKGGGTLAWKIEGDPEFVVVRTSSDGGHTWRTRVLAPSDGAGRPIELDRALLGHRGPVLLQVWATRGFRTVCRQHEVPHVEALPQPLVLLSPEVNSTVEVGRRVRLAAQSADPSATVTWTSDRDGALGTGAEIVARHLSAGRHLIEVRSTAPFELPVSFRLRVVARRRRSLP